MVVHGVQMGSKQTPTTEEEQEEECPTKRTTRTYQLFFPPQVIRRPHSAPDRFRLAWGKQEEELCKGAGGL